jgi:TonB family protein
VGEGGTAALRLTLAGDGTVEQVELVEDSGDLAKDAAFIRLARYFQFSLNVGERPTTQIVVVQPVVVSAR